VLNTVIDDFYLHNFVVNILFLIILYVKEDIAWSAVSNLLTNYAR